MEKSIADTPDYQDFEARHNRHLNMLQDNDRNIRRQALNEFKKAMDSNKNAKITEYFYRERLCKRLVICLEDQVEKNREIAIEIISTMVEQAGFQEESQIILPAIASRMIKTPYPEPSEEVRVQLIELLEVCLESDYKQFQPNIGQICSMLGRAGQDTNPDMKIKCASFCAQLAVKLDKQVGSYMKTVVDALTQNLAHQHSKVRKATLRGLKDVLSARGAEPYFEGNTMAQLKFVMNDRSQDVRATFYDVLFHWMVKIDLHYLRTYEAQFVQFLLNGIADDKLDISPKCLKFLDDHGMRMQDALKQLGELEEEEAEEEEPQKAVPKKKIENVEINKKMNNEEQIKSQYSNQAMDEID